MLLDIDNVLTRDKNIYFSYFIIFIFYLSFIISIGLGFQYFIVDLFYSSNSDYVFFSPDSIVANQHAIDLAHRLGFDFVQNITAYPAYGFSLNTALLGFFYYLFGVNPYINIFINSFFHASSSFLIFLCFLKFTEISKISITSSFFCSMIFLVWPTSILWLSEITKDFISFFSFILLIYGIIVFDSSKFIVDKIKSIIYLLASATLLFYTRDHYLQFHFMTILIFFSYLFYKSRIFYLNLLKKSNIKTLLITVVSLALVIIFGFFASKSSQDQKKPFSIKTTYNNFQLHSFGDINDSYKVLDGKQWISYTFIPKFIDQKLKNLSSINLVSKEWAHYSKSKTLLNENIFYLSSIDYIKQSPLILFQSFFEPNPLRFGFKEPQYLISAIEMFFIYICYLMLFFLRRKDYSKAGILIFCGVLIHILPFTIISSTYGTLYRLRSPYLLLFALTILKPFAEIVLTKLKKDF